MRPLRFQEHHTFNIVRWFDAHLDSALHSRVNGIPGVELGDARSELQERLRYCIIPVIEDGRVVLRVQVWIGDIATATLVRDLPDVDADYVYTFAGQVIDSILEIRDQRLGGHDEATAE